MPKYADVWRRPTAAGPAGEAPRAEAAAPGLARGASRRVDPAAQKSAGRADMRRLPRSPGRAAARSTEKATEIMRLHALHNE